MMVNQSEMKKPINILNLETHMKSSYPIVDDSFQKHRYHFRRSKIKRNFTNVYVRDYVFSSRPNSVLEQQSVFTLASF